MFICLLIQIQFFTLKNVYISTRAPTTLLKQELELELYTRHILTEVCIGGGMHVFSSKNTNHTKLYARHLHTMKF